MVRSKTAYDLPTTNHHNSNSTDLKQEEVVNQKISIQMADFQ